jgi:glutamate transport system permease protein
VPAYIVAAILFITMNYLLSRLAVYVEKRLSRRGRTTLHATGPLTDATDQGGPGAAPMAPATAR